MKNRQKPVRCAFPSFLLIAFVFAGLVIIPTPTARAGSTTTWTTTADFDSGDKGTFPLGGAWSWKVSPPASYDSGSGTGHGGYLYTFGGRLTGGSIRSEAFRYFPSNDTWQQLTSMNVALSATVAVTWADRLYVFPGYNGSGNPPVVQYYNVTTATWTTQCNSPACYPAGLSIDAPMATVYGGLVFVTNGEAGTNVQRFNPSTGAFTDLGCAITSGTSSTNGVVGNYWYFLGGLASTTVRRFNLDTNICDNSYDTTPFSARGEGSWSNPVINGLIYMINGFSSPPNVFYNDVWSYEPVGKIWTRLKSSNFDRASYAEGTVNGINYVVGGLSDQANYVTLTQVEAFDPSGSSDDARNLVESSTDSRAAASGSVQLATGIAESFYQNDHGSDLAFWTPVYTTSQGDCIRGVTNGNLSLVQPVAHGSNGGPYCDMYTTFAFSGNFDVRANLTAWESPSTANGFSSMMIANERVPLWSSTTTNDGAVWAMIALSATGMNLEAYTINNGVASACGTVPTVTGFYRYFRISASGTSWTFYYGTDGSSWTTHATCTQSNAGPWFFSELAAGGTIGRNGVGMRDFWLVAGTPNTGGFRASGTWTSPAVIVSGEIVKLVSWTATESGSNCVDAVALYKNAVLAETYDPSGCAFSPWTPNTQIGGSVTVEVTLAGTGAASPALLDVSLETGAGPPSEGGPWYPPIADFAYSLLHGMTVAFTDQSMRERDPWGAEIVKWYWDFGDGTTSEEQNPVHTYNEGRVYVTSLSVVDADGLSDKTTRFVAVNMWAEFSGAISFMLTLVIFAALFVVLFAKKKKR